MKFENAFDVKAPIDEVYATLLDIERVAPCMPGAQVLEKVSDSAYKVAVKVKLGPISMQYKGDVEIVERDDQAHRAVLAVKAREARGQGTADAHATMEMETRGDATHVVLTTDVQLSGKAAAMGQGVIQDVSARLVDQFAANLAAMLEAGDQTAEAEAQVEPEPTVGTADSSEGSGPSAVPPRATPPPPSQTDSISATDLAATVVKGRLRDPRTVAGLVVVGVVALWLLRRLRG